MLIYELLPRIEFIPEIRESIAKVILHQKDNNFIITRAPITSELKG